MHVDCENCAGCCVDWRALAPDENDDTDGTDRERRHRPLDDVHNLVVLTRGDVRAFVDAGLGDAMTPRLFADESGDGVTVDGHDLAAIDGRPVFFVGLRKPPKPVAPFGTDPSWLPTCAFLDPTTLQCRVHDDPLYPADCADFPGHDLALDVETECERVERAFGGTRLLDDEPPTDLPALALGPQAVGEKLFVVPEDASLSGVVDRVVAGDPRPADRALFVGTAAASAPGTTDTNPERRERVREAVLAADSWVGQAADEWAARAGGRGDGTDADADAPDPTLARTVEEERGAPATPGWE